MDGSVLPDVWIYGRSIYIQVLVRNLAIACLHDRCRDTVPLKLLVMSFLSHPQTPAMQGHTDAGMQSAQN